MSRKHDVNKEIENEVYCGTLPVLPKERKYGFMPTSGTSAYGRKS